MKRRSTLLVLLLIPTLLLGVPSFGFAQEAGSTYLKEVFAKFDVLISLLSWVWVVPAMIAGKLMTNAAVYGSAFFMDVYLWKLWQFMRTLAYYALGLLFLIKIVVGFVKQEPPSKMRETIKLTIIAGLLIPLTRWMIAALVDFSIIGTAAVSSFPLQAVQQQREEVKMDVTSPKRVIIDGNTVNNEDLSRADNIKTLELKDIMPQGDTVSGPLVFIGAALLNFFKLATIAESQSNISTLIILAGLKIIITLMLVVPMIVLMIVNMLRIFYIWLRVIFSPIIVLDQVFQGPLSQNEQFGKYFKPSNMIGLIFQPVAVVAVLSLGMILILGVVDIFNGGSQFEKDALSEFQIEQYADNQARIGRDANAEITITGNTMKDVGESIGGIVGELILAGFLALILWSLLAVAFSFSELTNATAKGIFKFSGDLMKSVPVVPLGGLGTYSVGGLQQAGRDINRNKLGLERKLDYQSDELAGRIDSVLGINNTNALSNADTGDLRRSSQSAKNLQQPSMFRESVKQKQKSKSMSMQALKPMISQRIGSGGGALLEQAGIVTKVPTTQEEIAALWDTSKNPKFTQFVDRMMTSKETTFPKEKFVQTARTASGQGLRQLKDTYEPINE